MDRAPSFTEKPKISRSGKDIAFQCALMAKPKPEVVWSRDGQPLITTDPRLVVATEEIGDDHYKLLLTLKDAVENDSGSYSVKVNNSLGSMTANIGLNLR